MSDPNSSNATSTTNEVFGSKPDQEVNDKTSTESSDQFLGLVGDGAKYKTPEDLAKSRIEADQFIDQLKSENAGLREELENRPSKEEVLDIIKATQDEQSTHHSTSLDEDAIGKLVESRLSERETRQLHTSNLETASEAVLAVHGDKAADVVKAKAQELGTSVDYLMQMAAENPNIFYATMGLNKPTPKPKGGFTPPASNSAEGVGNEQRIQNAPQGTWDYYEEMRVNNPKEYWSPKVQNEMFQARKKGGEGFYKP